MPEMHPVESSQISHIGHDAATNTLHVRFKGKGSEYTYPNFTAEHFAAFKGAEGIGKHFGQHIKDNEKHPHTKVK